MIVTAAKNNWYGSSLTIENTVDTLHTIAITIKALCVLPTKLALVVETQCQDQSCEILCHVGG
jgi:purine-cytosine permease-like protein